MFEISSSQLEFWIEGSNELPYWTIQEITSDTENIKNEIKKIFTSSIEIKYKMDTIKLTTHGKNKEDKTIIFKPYFEN